MARADSYEHFSEIFPSYAKLTSIDTLISSRSPHFKFFYGIATNHEVRSFSHFVFTLIIYHTLYLVAFNVPLPS